MFSINKKIKVKYDSAFENAGKKLCEFLKMFYGVEAEVDDNADIFITKGNIEEENYSL
jgi:hypothetical protein